MEKFLLEGKANTPSVSLDPDTGELEISGKSIPEKALEFYKPIANWLEDYVKEPVESTTVTFALEYYNSRSKKFLYSILRSLKSLQDEGKKVTINWYYEKGDEEVEETGIAYKDLLKMDINVLELDED